MQSRAVISNHQAGCVEDNQTFCRSKLTEHLNYIINILNCIPRLSRPFVFFNVYHVYLGPFCFLFDVYMSHCRTAGNDISGCTTCRILDNKADFDFDLITLLSGGSQLETSR